KQENCSKEHADRSPWEFVVWSFASVLASVLAVPAFSVPTGPGFVALPGTLIGATTGLTAAWAFVRCPRRPVFPKVVTLLLLVPGLFIGMDCVTSYLMIGINR